MSRAALDYQLPRVNDANAFGRVAVLLGGASSERDISLMTGSEVLAALERRGIDAQPFDPSVRSVSELVEQAFARAWIALHGPGGEDGTIQGALETLGVPYTGSGVLGSALGMDKLRTKLLFRASGLATPPFALLRSERDLAAAIARLGFPMITKPASSGSSVGMRKVESAPDLDAAFLEAVQHDPDVIAEAWIEGTEYTAAVLHGEVLPLIRIETPRTFYDYEAKYFSDTTRYVCPCGLALADERRLAQRALEAFQLIGGWGWGRVDFIVDRQGTPQFLEGNTVPGMTNHSLVPMAARQAEIDFDELCWRILETSFGERAVGRAVATRANCGAS